MKTAPEGQERGRGDDKRLVVLWRKEFKPFKKTVKRAASERLMENVQMQGFRNSEE